MTQIARGFHGTDGSAGCGEPAVSEPSWANAEVSHEGQHDSGQSQPKPKKRQRHVVRVQDGIEAPAARQSDLDERQNQDGAAAQDRAGQVDPATRADDLEHGQLCYGGRKSYQAYRIEREFRRRRGE